MAGYPKNLEDVVGTPFKAGQIVSYPVQTPQGLRISLAEISQVGTEVVHLRAERADGSEYNFMCSRPDRLTVTTLVRR